MIVIDENKSFADILTSGNAPFLTQLTHDGASLTDFHSSHHPSQPNYIDFFAGDTLGVCDDSCPASTFNAPNLGAALASAGFSFAGFAENLPSSPATQRCHKGLYASKHAPWVNFTNVAASASRNFSQFPHDNAGFSQLPTVSLVIPNLTNDMHNGSGLPTEVKTGDAWLKAHLAAYATWAQTHNSLLIVTWDEDSYTGYHIHCPNVIQTPAPHDPNLIATIIAGAPVQAGATSSTTYSHHDLLRTILDMYGVPPFAGAASAKDITGIWK